ncbi:hypothetical protein MP228_005009, partial [Amoeboaphelidium protococcarum]
RTVSGSEWFLDSGASTHCCNDKDAFIELSACSGMKVQNYGGSDKELVCAGVGTVILNVVVDGERRCLKLENVMHFPGASCSLMSVSKLKSSGKVTLVDLDSQFVIQSKASNKKLCVAVLEKGLYRIVIEQPQKVLNVVNLISQHAQPPQSYVNVNLSEQRTFEFCDDCLSTKLQRAPFQPSDSIYSNPLDLVVSDLSPCNIRSFHGFKYVMTLMDMATRKLWSYMLKNKSEAFGHFKRWLTLVENESSFKLKKFRSDGGGEYIYGEFRTFLADRGVAIQSTTAHTPQQNGNSERVNQTLWSMARTFLKVFDTPHTLWPDAIMAACYVKNRLPHSAVNFKLPEELWTGKRASLFHLRTMFCLAYVRHSKSTFKKLDDRSFPAVFAGYSLEKKAWRFYSLDLNKIIFSRDVVFLENKAPMIQPSFVYKREQFELMDESDQSAVRVSAQDIYNSAGLGAAVDPTIEELVQQPQISFDAAAATRPTTASINVEPNAEPAEVTEVPKEIVDDEFVDAAEYTQPIDNAITHQDEDISDKTAKALLKLQKQLQIDMNDTKVMKVDVQDSKIEVGNMHLRVNDPKIEVDDIVGIARSITQSRRHQLSTPTINFVSANPFQALDDCYEQDQPSTDMDDSEQFHDAVENLEQEYWYHIVDPYTNKVYQTCAFAYQELNRVFEDPQSYDAALKLPDGPQWDEGTQEEFSAHVENGTFILIDEDQVPKGEQILTSKLVFKYKTDATGHLDRRKVRWCIRGFLQEMDWAEIFAPVIKYATIRILLVLASLFKWQLTQFDVKTAFLNAFLKRPVYTRPPKGFKIPKGKIMKLLKSVYGLKEAPKLWNDLLTKSLKSIGFNCINSDISLYMFKLNGQTFLLAVYVDDMVLAGPSGDLYNKICEDIMKLFKVRNLGWPAYFLGAQIKTNSDSSFTLNQEKYIRSIVERFDMRNEHHVKTPCATYKLDLSMCPQDESQRQEMEQIPYQQAVGCLMHLVQCCRPDIAYAVSQVARFMKNPGMKHWLAVKRIYGYLQSTAHMGIEIDCTKAGLTGFSDSDHCGNLDHSKSTSGYVFYLCGVPVSWKSSLQPIVALSSVEAEYIALAAAVKEGIWIKQLLYELQLQDVAPQLYSVPRLFADNQGSIYLTKASQQHHRTRHIRLRYHFLRQEIQDRTLDVEFVRSNANVADVFTKGLGKNLHWL